MNTPIFQQLPEDTLKQLRELYNTKAMVRAAKERRERFEAKHRDQEISRYLKKKG